MLSVLLMRSQAMDPDNLWISTASSELRLRYWVAWVVTSGLLTFLPLTILAPVVSGLVDAGRTPVWKQWLFAATVSLLAFAGAIVVAFMAAIVITGDGP
jgi:hypothetical protein